MMIDGLTRGTQKKDIEKFATKDGMMHLDFVRRAKMDIINFLLNMKITLILFGFWNILIIKHQMGQLFVAMMHVKDHIIHMTETETERIDTMTEMREK